MVGTMTMAGDQKPVVCFGEMLLRLSPPIGVPLSRTGSLDLAVGGAEANVAIALSGLGRPSRMLTVLPDNALGRRAIASLGEAGVDTGYIRHARGRLGLYFFEPPSGPIGGRVTYDRANSAFANARGSDLDFTGALDGAGLLHLSGITPSLGPAGSDLALAAVAAAKIAGVPVCFDGNYRANLWVSWDSNPREILTRLVGDATILIGNHRDISLLLGKTFSGESPDRRREAAEAAFVAFPRLQVIASTARHVESATAQRLAGRVDSRDDHWQTHEVRIDPVVDRIGTGDAFAAGVVFRWLDGGNARAMAETGLALAAIKHGIIGDSLCVTRDELDAFDPTGADVSR